MTIKNIYADGELNESSTTEEFSIVQQELYVIQTKKA